MVVHKHLPRFNKIFQTSKCISSPCQKKRSTSSPLYFPLWVIQFHCPHSNTGVRNPSGPSRFTRNAGKISTVLIDSDLLRKGTSNQFSNARITALDAETVPPMAANAAETGMGGVIEFFRLGTYIWTVQFTRIQ